MFTEFSFQSLRGNADKYIERISSELYFDDLYLAELDRGAYGIEPSRVDDDDGSCTDNYVDDIEDALDEFDGDDF